ncbi:ABC transporter permease [Salinibacillus xinjiangensis]|uniref:ABC transporter permease n=1 Tax=Salinibacillus xinjiangensis TaxID=1229268 RepID=UPI002B27B1C0|nr:ABC transporter permease subunit [Salinibacillus xinjiangensis]
MNQLNKEKWIKKIQDFAHSPLWVLTQKEITDHIKSFRFNILMGIILLTCVGSLYTALSTIRDVASNIESNQQLFLYLKVFTITDEGGTLPSFVTFVSFLGPLLGISLGFDAVNSERNKNTLLRVMSQPIPRDYIILAKFLGAISVIASFIFSLGFLVIGIGIVSMGIPPTFEEFIRIMTYLVMIIVYIGFWLALSILFSIRFKQAATSALAGISIWLFFSIFYGILVNLIVNTSVPDQLFQQAASVQQQSQELLTTLMRFSPNYLFTEITTILLTPSFRTLGPISMEQVAGTIPAPLELAQSLTIIWPQVIGILSAAVICFAISYFIFLFQEIRS